MNYRILLLWSTAKLSFLVKLSSDMINHSSPSSPSSSSSASSSSSSSASSFFLLLFVFRRQLLLLLLETSTSFFCFRFLFLLLQLLLFLPRRQLYFLILPQLQLGSSSFLSPASASSEMSFKRQFHSVNLELFIKPRWCLLIIIVFMSSSLPFWFFVIFYDNVGHAKRGGRGVCLSLHSVLFPLYIIISTFHDEEGLGLTPPRPIPFPHLQFVRLFLFISYSSRFLFLPFANKPEPSWICLLLLLRRIVSCACVCVWSIDKTQRRGRNRKMNLPLFATPISWICLLLVHEEETDRLFCFALFHLRSIVSCVCVCVCVSWSLHKMQGATENRKMYLPLSARPISFPWIIEMIWGTHATKVDEKKQKSKENGSWRVNNKM